MEPSKEMLNAIQVTSCDATLSGAAVPAKATEQHDTPEQPGPKCQRISSTKPTPAGKTALGNMKKHLQSMDTRSLEEVDAEMRYLAMQLQQHNQRACRLLREWELKQEELQADGANPGTAVRKLRKELNYIQYRIEQTEQQERQAIQQLGHACAALQRRIRSGCVQQFHLPIETQRMTADATRLACVPPVTPVNRVLVPHPSLAFEYRQIPSDVGYGDAFSGSTTMYMGGGPISFSPSPSLLSPMSPVGCAPSPMSPLATVFQPRTMDATDMTDATNTAWDVRSGPDSRESVLAETAWNLGATSLGMSQDTVGEAGAGAESGAESGTESGVGQHYTTAAETPETFATSPRMRRNSYCAPQAVPAKSKRMSLPLEQLAWPKMQ